MRKMLAILWLVAECGVAGAAEPRQLAKGKVVDDQGRPVARANVVAMLDDATSSDSHYTRTGEDGTFSVWVNGEAKYTRIRLYAGMKGYSDAKGVATPPMGNEQYQDATLALRPAVDFVVNVTDTTGRAVSGAEITVVRDYSEGEAHEKPLVTDGAGKAEMKGKNDTEWMTLEVEADGFLKRKIWLQDLREKSARVILSKGGTFLCQLVDAETGKPLENAEVELPGLASRCRTEKDGIFHAVDVPFGTVNVALPGSGYTADWDHALNGFSAEFAAGSENALHKISVRHDYVIEGDVVDKDDRPVAGVMVWVAPLDFHGPIKDKLAARAVTDAKGHFRFSSFSVDHFKVGVGDGYVSDPVELKYKEMKGAIRILVEKRK